MIKTFISNSFIIVIRSVTVEPKNVCIMDHTGLYRHKTHLTYHIPNHSCIIVKSMQYKHHIDVMVFLIQTEYPQLMFQ